MSRWLGSAALAAVLAVGLSVGADKVANTKAGKALGELQSEYENEFKAAGKDDKKRAAVFEKYSPKFLDHAKQNAKDETAVLALELVLQLNPAEGKSKVRAEAIELLKKEYVKSKQIANILRTLANLGSSITSDADALVILKAVAKDNPDKLIRATAVDELASGLEFRTLVIARLSRDEKALASYEKQFGQDFVKKFLDSSDDAKKEAEGLRATLEKEYAGVLPTDDPKPAFDGGKMRVGTKAPETACLDIAGLPVKLSDLEGKVVVLDFWATWCGPCRAMIPHTREMVKANEKKPFVFVSVSCDAERETLETFTQKTPMPWTHWWDGQGGKVAKAYEVRAFPTIYVIDHKGVIQFKSVGYDKKMDSVIEKLVKEAEAQQKKD